jgi:hypothetical protein
MVEPTAVGDEARGVRPVKSTVPSVRDHCGRGRTTKSPSVQGQGGNGAALLRQDGDGRQ